MAITKRICVIGASGVVGSHVCQTALRKGYKVNACMRNPQDNLKTYWLRQLEHADGNMEFMGGDLDLPGSYLDAVKGCEGVFICALPETPSEPKLIETVERGVKHILRSCLEAGTHTVIITSSTEHCLLRRVDWDNDSSTNPKEVEPPMRDEIEDWLDPDFEFPNSQKGKYSPSAKTLVDKTALAFEEGHPDMRIVIFNPSMILGPMFHPEMHGSLAFFRAILNGERLKEIPNDSMSFIDVRDLAELELAALENKNARGRYFGVVASWHWKDIVDTIKRHYPEYSVPPCNYEDNDIKDIAPTKYDHTRKNSLKVNLRGLDEIIGQAIEHLKHRGELVVHTEL